MGEGPELSLREGLASGPDPRHPPGRRHPLASILAFGGGRQAGRRSRRVCQSPVGVGASGVAPSPGLYRTQPPGVATWQSCFPAVGWAVFAAALTRWARAAPPPDKQSVLAGDAR